MIVPLVLVLAQSVAARVAAAPDGTVRLAFAARPGVCGHARGVTEDDAGDCGCEAGPARLALTVRDGAVQSIRTRVGGHWAPLAAGAAVTDLGTVAVRDAVNFLLDLAARDAGRAGEEAIFPATIADSVTVWPVLLRLARDDHVARHTRRQAVFWLGQAAGEAATRGLTDLVDDQAVDRDVREQAVFALSQRPRDEGVPALIRIARTHRDPEVRKKAIFWLGQSDDPRALALFEELLTKP
jgi:HEAT repeat protein